jgi:transposase-like protein
MDKKEEIINEYLIGGITFRSLGKKYGISRSTINRFFAVVGLPCPGVCVGG